MADLNSKRPFAVIQYMQCICVNFMSQFGGLQIQKAIFYKGINLM